MLVGYRGLASCTFKPIAVVGTGMRPLKSLRSARVVHVAQNPWRCSLDAKTFVNYWKTEKDELLREFMGEKGSASITAKLISSIGLTSSQSEQLRIALDAVLTDTMYALLLGLDGGPALAAINTRIAFTPRMEMKFLHVDKLKQKRGHNFAARPSALRARFNLAQTLTSKCQYDQ